MKRVTVSKVFAASIVMMAFAWACNPFPAPSVVDVSPRFEAENVFIDEPLEFIFDQEVVPNSCILTVESQPLAGGDVQTIEMAEQELGFNNLGQQNHRLLVRPIADYGLSSQVTAVLTGCANAGDPNVVMENEFRLVFSTADSCTPSGELVRTISEQKRDLLLPAGSTGGTVDIEFEASLDPATATDSRNWGLSGLGAATITDLQASGNVVSVTLEGVNNGDLYLLQATQLIKSVCGDDVAGTTTTIEVTVDNIPPEVIDTTFPPGVTPCGTDSIDVEVMFSEPVTGVLNESAISIGNGATITNVQGEDGTEGPYTFSVSSLVDGNIYFASVGDGVRDIAGNPIAEVVTQPVMVCVSECALPEYTETEQASPSGGAIIPNDPTGQGNSNFDVASAEVAATSLDFEDLEESFYNIAGKLQIFNAADEQESPHVDMFRLGTFENSTEYVLEVNVDLDGSQTLASSITQTSEFGGIVLEIVDAGGELAASITQGNPIELETQFASTSYSAQIKLAANQILEGLEYYLRIYGVADIAPGDSIWELDYCISLFGQKFPFTQGCGEDCTEACDTTFASTVEGTGFDRLAGETGYRSYTWSFLPRAMEDDIRAQTYNSFPCDAATGKDGVIRIDKEEDDTFLIMNYNQETYAPTANTSNDAVWGVFRSCTGSQVGESGGLPMCVNNSTNDDRIYSLPAGTYFLWFANENSAANNIFQGADVTVEEYMPAAGESCATGVGPLTEDALNTNILPSSNFTTFATCFDTNDGLYWAKIQPTENWLELDYGMTQAGMAVFDPETDSFLDCTQNGASLANGGEPLALLVEPGQEYCIAMEMFAGITQVNYQTEQRNVVRVLTRHGAPQNIPQFSISGDNCFNAGSKYEETVSIPGDAAAPSVTNHAIVDVELRIDVTHDGLEDLDIYLQFDPDNGDPICTPVATDAMFGINMRNTLFDDEARVDIVTGTAPYTGRHTPEFPLSFFDGLAMNGDWTLIVQDDNTSTWSGGSGDVNEWEIYLFWDEIFEGEACSAPHDLTASGMAESVLPLDSRYALGTPSCMPANQAVNWYSYQMLANEGQIDISADAAGEVGILVNGSEAFCTTDLSGGITLITGGGAEVCVAVPELSAITSLTLTAGPDPCTDLIDIDNPVTTTSVTSTATSYAYFVAPDSDPAGDVCMADNSWNIDACWLYDKVTGTRTIQTIGDFTSWYFNDLVNVDGDFYAVRSLTSGNIVYKVFDDVTGWLNPVEPIGSHSTFEQQYRMFYDQTENRIYTAPSSFTYGTNDQFLQYVDLDDCTAPPCAMTIEHDWATDIRYIRGFAIDQDYIYLHAWNDSINTVSSYDVFREEIATGNQSVLPGISNRVTTSNSQYSKFHLRDVDGDNTMDYMYYEPYRQDVIFELCGPAFPTGLVTEYQPYGTLFKGGSLSGYDPVNDKLWRMETDFTAGRAVIEIN